jgi:hypothetical protein
MATQRICSVEGCGKRASHREWCNAHYKRWRRNGDPLAGRTQVGEQLAFLMTALEAAQPGDCMIWPYQRSWNGRGKVFANGKSQGAHRIACEHRHGPPPSGDHEAAHDCGNGHLGCFSPFHMRWATPAQNQADRLIHGTMLRGNSHPRASLTEDQVREVRRLYATGEYSQRQLAEQFGVARRTIGAMTDGQNWKWMDAA